MKYSFVFSVLLFVIFFGLVLFLPLPAFAQTSWLNGWSYRIGLNVENFAGTSLTNYPVQVNLDTLSISSINKMRSDCGDIRFTDSDGVTKLQYWLEEGCGSSNTKLWVKIPYLSSDIFSQKKIYMYYGNPNAVSESDVNSVFSFFDDFNGTTKFTNVSYPYGEPVLCLNPPQTNIFQYELPIYISSTGTTLINYTVMINLTNTTILNSIQPDGRDIRFFNQSTSSPYSSTVGKLPYWIENISSSQLIVWVKIDNIPASGGKTIYIYYGKSDATTTSNGTNTFLVWDDFNDNSIDTNKWNTGVYYGGSISESGGELIESGDGDWHGAGAQTKQTLTKSDTFEIKYKHRIPATYSSGDSTHLYLLDPSVGRDTTYGGPLTASDLWPVGITTFPQRSYKIIVNGPSGTYSRYLWSGTAWNAEVTDGAIPNWASIPNSFVVEFFRGHYGAYPGYWDDIILRKYVSPEPTVNVLPQRRFSSRGVIEDYNASIPCDNSTQANYVKHYNQNGEQVISLGSYDEGELRKTLSLPPDTYKLTLRWRAEGDSSQLNDSRFTNYDDVYGADSLLPKRLIVVNGKKIYEKSGSLTSYSETMNLIVNSSIDTLYLAYGSAYLVTGRSTFYDQIIIRKYVSPEPRATLESPLDYFVLTSGETNFTVMSIIIFPIEVDEREGDYGGNPNYSQTLLTPQHPLGLRGDTNFLQIKWDSRWPDESLKNQGVRCYLNCPNPGDNIEVNCVSYDKCEYIGPPGKHSCIIQNPDYLFKEINNITCKFFDPSNPQVYYAPYPNRSFFIIDYQNLAPSSLSLTLGEPYRFVINIKNLGLIPTSFFVNFTDIQNPINPVPLFIEGRQTTTEKVSYGKVVSATPQITFFSTGTANFRTDVKSTLEPTQTYSTSCSVVADCPSNLDLGDGVFCLSDNRCWQRKNTSIMAGLKSLSEFDAFGIIQIILLSTILFLLSLKIKSKKQIL